MKDRDVKISVRPVTPVSKPLAPNNCAIREHTADRVSVGRCMFHCPDDQCPRHGDVSMAMKKFRETGHLTNDFDLPK